MARNSYEEAARTKKVLALLAHVPTGGNRIQNQIIAETLAAWSQEEREIFAKAAGCNPPSDETWKQLLKAVKARKTMEQVEEELDDVFGPKGGRR